MEKVSLVACNDYKLSLLKSKILESLENIGYNFHSFKNKKVGIKPNLLTAEPPEKAIITHPEFFRAIAQIVKENGGSPILIESPAFLTLERVLKYGHYTSMLEEEGIAVADPANTISVYSDEARKFKTFMVSQALQEVDIIINLPKLKTHSLTYMTICVKNLFGTIYSLNKAKCHIKAKDNNAFSNLLLDLYTCLLYGLEGKEIIHVVDAIVGLEGEGPGTSGNAKKIGSIVAGLNAIAVDIVATTLVGLNPGNVVTIVEGAQRNLGPNNIDDIEIIGNSLQESIIKNFQPASKSPQSLMLKIPFGNNILRRLLIERPVPQKGICTLCYQCKKICPAGAISLDTKKKGVPHYDYDACIRCLCCMEICPEAAIVSKKGILQAFMEYMVTRVFPKIPSFSSIGSNKSNK